MAGRGRGRGGGRGRGAGGAASHLRDELKGIDTSVLQPPPLYPPLAFKPVPLKLGPEYSSRVKSTIGATSSTPPFRFFREDLMTEWKLQLRHLFKEEIKKDIDRYSDRYAEIPSLPRQNCDIDFNRIPKELKPSVKRKSRAKQSTVKKKIRVAESSALFENLEALEKEVKEETEADEPDGEKPNKEEVEEEEEEVAYDSENEEDDYNENYFDNGEEFSGDSDGSGAEAYF